MTFNQVAYLADCDDEMIRFKFILVPYIALLIPIILLLIGRPSRAQENPVIDELNLMNELKILNPDSAFFVVKSAYLEAQRSKNERLKSRCALHLGEIQYYLGDFENASTYLIEGIKYFESSGDQYNLARAYTWLGATSQYSKQFQVALDYYSRSLAIYESLSDTINAGEVLGWIGHYYEKTGRQDTAIIIQLNALDLIASQDSSARALGKIYDNIGSIYEDMSRYDSAHYYFFKSLCVNKKYGDINYQIVNLNNIGDIYRKKSLIDLALTYTDSALTLAYQYDIDYQKRSAHRDLSKLYAFISDFELAFRHADSAYHIYSNMINEENIRRMNLLHALYESERQENMIEILEQDKKINRLLRAGMIGVFLVFVVVTVLIVRSQRIKIARDKKIIEQKNHIMAQNSALADLEKNNAQLKEERLHAEIKNQKLTEQKLQQNLELKSQLVTSQALQIIRKNNFLENLKQELQQIKISEKAERFDRINSLMKYINQDISNDENWNDFNMIFSQVHKDFFSNLLNKYPDISAAEVRLCSLIKLNLQSSEIATILGISRESLRIARHRLRKRLQLAKDENLPAFITNI